jgi:hypothetical protein
MRRIEDFHDFKMAGRAILSPRETKPERGQERKPGKVKFEVFPVWTLVHKADILFKHTGVTPADKSKTEDCYFSLKTSEPQSEKGNF